MKNYANETITILERTIDGKKVVSFASGDSGEGELLVEQAEAQDMHWGEQTINWITVFDKSQILAESIFTVPAGGISSAGPFEIQELYLVLKSLRDGVPATSI